MEARAKNRHAASLEVEAARLLSINPSSKQGKALLEKAISYKKSAAEKTKAFSNEETKQLQQKGWQQPSVAQPVDNLRTKMMPDFIQALKKVQAVKFDQAEDGSLNAAVQSEEKAQQEQEAQRQVELVQKTSRSEAEKRLMQLMGEQSNSIILPSAAEQTTRKSAADFPKSAESMIEQKQRSRIVDSLKSGNVQQAVRLAEKFNRRDLTDIILSSQTPEVRNQLILGAQQKGEPIHENNQNTAATQREDTADQIQNPEPQPSQTAATQEDVVREASKTETNLDFDVSRKEALKAKLLAKSKPKKLVNVVDDSDAALAEALADLKGSLDNLSTNPMFNPDLMGKALRVGLIYAQRGVNNFAEWSEKMTGAAGDKITPYLPSTWSMINSFPEGKKFDADTVNELFEYAGIAHKEGHTTEEALSKVIAEDLGEEYTPFAKMAYNGIKGMVKGGERGYDEHGRHESVSEVDPERAETIGSG